MLLFDKLAKPGTFAITLCITALSGCGALGDTKSLKSANELAINCKTDEALAALDRAEAGGGLGTYLAELERVGILRDAGRTEAAEKALQLYLDLPETQSTSTEDVESSIEKFIAELRQERLEQTGSATCP